MTTHLDQNAGPSRVVVTGGYLSQNMGAAAMSIVTARELRARGLEPLFLSKYPGDDAPLARRYGCELQPASQIFYTVLVLPALLAARLIPGLAQRIRRRWFPGVVLFYDLGGITFSAERGIVGFLINATWLLLPLLMDVPVVKGAQAVGPFSTWYLRWLAPPLLRRVVRLHARGAVTAAALSAARVPCVFSADIAFLLEPEPVPERLCARVMRGPYVALVPSAVVASRFQRVHGEGTYIELLAILTAALAARGIDVIIVPHCFRDTQTWNSNDVPICRALMARCDSPRVSLIESFGSSPGELKALIGGAALCVTGRFHGMVAALSSGVPVVVTSWSHKYLEVLSAFGQEAWMIDWQSLNIERLLARVDSALAQRDALAARIRSALPQVMDSARKNFSDLSRYVKDRV